ncbi:MAG: PxxKW family cysteine-rich protein [Deltaproteobacteria bacterium]|nr:PxxKW family cysteine-rich protein [Deltaproteobacteria bacterium]
MLCDTVKEGINCSFMSKKGCTFNQGACHPIIDKCEGCDKIKEFPSGRYCTIFPEPAIKWKSGHCNMATHVKIVVQEVKTKLNPLKASKRASR